MLADFHAALPGRRAVTSSERAASSARSSATSSELLAVAELHAERERIRSLRALPARVHGARAALRARDRAGAAAIRECHGDLRAEHVVLADPVDVVDCVEFDPRAANARRRRRSRVPGDGPDGLRRRAVRGSARRRLSRRRGRHLARMRCSRSSPSTGRWSEPRSCWCARPASRPSSAAHGHAQRPARELLLAVAERFAWRARLPLAIVLCGVPGERQVPAGRGARPGSRACHG